MAHLQKILGAILFGQKDKNISFVDIQNLLLKLGFRQRIKGDHHIFSKSGVEEIINLQPLGNNAKPYQVKQVRNIILKYKLALEDNDDE